MNASTFLGLLKSRFPRPARILGLMLALAGTPAFGQATVTSLTDANHGKAGFANGNTFNTAQFRFPAGIALDPSGSLLFVADATNNAIRMVNNLGNQSSSWTFTAYNAANGISHPIGIAVNADTNIFVLNFGNGKNGSLMVFNGYYYVNYGIKSVISTNATHLTNAAGISLDSSNNAYITVKGNTVIRVTPAGVSSVVGVVTNAKTSLRGLAYLVNGKLAIADSGNHGIWMMDPTNTNIFNNAVKFTGFHGAADTNGPAAFAAFNSPQTVIQAGNGVLVVADRLNHKVKTVDAYGNVNRLYGVKQKYWSKVANLATPGWNDGTVNPIETQDMVQSRQPYGLALAADGTLYDTETYYNILRRATGSGLFPPPPPPPNAPTILTVTTNFGQVTLTWSMINTATNYNVKRSQISGGPYSLVASTTATSYTDTNVVNGTTYYYVVSALNATGESPNSTEVSAMPPLPAVPDPQIGYVDFPPPNFTSVFHAGSQAGATFNNDVPIVIIGPTGSQTFYTFTNTTVVTNVPDPATSPSRSSAPVGYVDGLFSIAGLTIAQVLPDLNIKAIGEQTNHPNSSVVSALFQFVVGNPGVFGNNAAQFSISNITDGAQMWYTLDGSDPTNAPPSLGPISSGTTLSLNFGNNTNLLFRIRGFKNNYHPSELVTKVFLINDFVPNIISFGFATGPGSSRLVASPGQSFVVPVSLSLLPDAPPIYGLQFNLTVTNLGSHAIAPGDVDFQSLLGKPSIFQDGYYDPIPNYVFISTSQPINDTNAFYYNGGWYQNLQFSVANNQNLLGVGWLEILGRTNLYNTLGQNLLTFPIVDGTDPSATKSQAVVGGYFFGIPTNAVGGDVYQIQIGRPSATTFPGLSVNPYGIPVFIDAPANTNFVGPGSISALKNVTIGQIKYLVGDVYPANWYNAGDFGSSNLINIDVIRVFDFAAYPIGHPPESSDLFDALDSCGNYGYANGFGYYTNASTYPYYNTYTATNYTAVYDTNGIPTTTQSSTNDYTSPIYITTYFVSVPYYITNIYLATPPAAPTTNIVQTNYIVSITPAVNTLFDATDTNINQIAFGDGVLDVCDVYVTFRRSLDPSLTWYERFWTNGVRAADTGAINHAAHFATRAATSSTIQPKIQSFSTSSVPPQVTFAAGVVQGSAGQTVQVPITATIQGGYPLRLLMLNLSVLPLASAPGLSAPVQFNQTATELGSPYTTDSTANGNFSAVWLNYQNSATGAGVSGTNVTLGTLSVTIPAGTPSGTGYGVFFDHASASPNGLASFPIQTVPGTITIK